VNKFARCDN